MTSTEYIEQGRYRCVCVCARVVPMFMFGYIQACVPFSNLYLFDLQYNLQVAPNLVFSLLVSFLQRILT